MEEWSIEKQKLRFRLQFFAAEGPGGEKTEEATTKKLEDARKEGQVAMSHELTTALSLMGLFMALKIFVGSVGTDFLELFKGGYNGISTIVMEGFDLNTIGALFQEYIVQILLIALPFFAIAVAVGFISNVAQVKWKVTGKPLMPKLSKINPISGFKKIFSLDKVVELIKSIAKILVIFILVYTTMKDKVGELQLLYQLGSLQGAIALIGDEVINLGIKISAFFLVIGFADLIYQKLKFKKDMRMTKQEVKDEYKQTEGDPQVKGKIRQRMREASQRRMMQKLPEADVVITNPTHFACAIKYDKEVASAPVLLAKGADYVAAKIREAAKEHDIPIVENKPLARMLYYNVELEQEIPAELYQMTAEVLAYVYNLKNRAG
ncbi:MAG: flagellar biosynthesis protein FlhB [Lachnospiraceae bacterium]|nr:flagellar biosynthesis protein FlhB [Lachnospiraceae bacterium]